MVGKASTPRSRREVFDPSNEREDRSPARLGRGKEDASRNRSGVPKRMRQHNPPVVAGGLPETGQSIGGRASSLEASRRDSTLRIALKLVSSCEANRAGRRGWAGWILPRPTSGPGAEAIQHRSECFNSICVCPGTAHDLATLRSTSSRRSGGCLREVKCRTLRLYGKRDAKWVG